MSSSPRAGHVFEDQGHIPWVMYHARGVLDAVQALDCPGFLLLFPNTRFP